MSIRRPRIPALAGVPLLALAACSDLLTDDLPGATRVLVQADEASAGLKIRPGTMLRLTGFASDPGGLGVEGVELRWMPDDGDGAVQATRNRTNGNGFVEAAWTAGTAAGRQRLVVEAVGIGRADTLEISVVPDTVVGTVELAAPADTLVEGESQTVTVTGVADRYGNPYDFAQAQAQGLPPLVIATLDPAVLEVRASGTTAQVTGVAPGTGRVVALVGGRADTVTVTVRKFVAPGSFGSVRAGAYYGCAITLAGAAHCWGENGAGQLGTGDTEARAVPTAVALPAGTVASRVSAGEIHSCALAAGEAWCWGDNSVGQLGNGTTDPQSGPVKVDAPAGTAFVAAEAGLAHSCALTDDGAAWCWGDNSSGQLGREPGDPSPAPVRVEVPAGVAFTQLTAGAIHSCAVTAAGALWCWGDNSTGQLGVGSFDPVAGAAEVQASGVARVDAGLLHSCAASTSGAVSCWGDNSYGQLGDGTTDPAAAPVPVSGALAAAWVSAGQYHSCAVGTDGQVSCWGWNGSGQLGNDTDVDSAVPVAVQSGGMGFVAVDAGYEHTCALGTDSEAYCWGRNGVGELGTGVVGGRSLTPARVVSPLTPAASRRAPQRSAAPAPTRPSASRRGLPAGACRALPSRFRAKSPSC